MTGFLSIFASLVLAVWVVFLPVQHKTASKAIATECWFGIGIYGYDDLRAGANTFATFDIEFWRGERIVAHVANPGETIPGGQRTWRFPAHSQDSYGNGVRRVILSYRLAPGDGLLLQPDTWRFAAPIMKHYCSTGNVSEADDDFLKNPYRDMGPNSRIELGEREIIRTLTGAGTVTIYEDPEPDPRACRTDSDCSDRIICNGIELCRPGKLGSDARGCRAGTPITCGRDQSCVELLGGCARSSCADPDKDGDGSAAVECGGTDCNDNDRNMYPGKAEYWDAQNHDEDCDLNSNGSARFFNAPQVCDGAGSVILIPSLRRAACPGGSVCIPQPYGGGFCAGKTDGYLDPPRFTAPLQQTGHPLQTRKVDRNIPPTIIPPMIRPFNFFKY